MLTFRAYTDACVSITADLHLQQLGIDTSRTKRQDGGGSRERLKVGGKRQRVSREVPQTKRRKTAVVATNDSGEERGGALADGMSGQSRGNESSLITGSDTRYGQESINTPWYGIYMYYI